MLQIKRPQGAPMEIGTIKDIKPAPAPPTCGGGAPDQLDKPPC